MCCQNSLPGQSSTKRCLIKLKPLIGQEKIVLIKPVCLGASKTVAVCSVLSEFTPISDIGAIGVEVEILLFPRVTLWEILTGSDWGNCGEIWASLVLTSFIFAWMSLRLVPVDIPICSDCSDTVTRVSSTKVANSFPIGFKSFISPLFTPVTSSAKVIFLPLEISVSFGKTNLFFGLCRLQSSRFISTPEVFVTSTPPKTLAKDTLGRTTETFTRLTACLS